MEDTRSTTKRPIVLITGAAGKIGTAITQAIKADYHVIGLDIVEAVKADESYRCDLTSANSVQGALNHLAGAHGRNIAAVVHLAAYFDFTGEQSPLYDAVNVAGTRNLLKALQHFEVERFIYSGTMLVHEPGSPGHKITEDTPIAPSWIYPQSKAETEAVIREYAGDMPCTFLRLAGLYDEESCVPTLAQQIARIYERDFKSHLYSGDTGVGQAFVHQEDMIDAFRRTIDRRKSLAQQHALLIGEDWTISYEALQNRLGELIHGKEQWKTLTLPAPLAKAGAWAEEHAEPLIPDDFDQGEKPFVRPFMIDMAEDHYELDISRAEAQLGWRPRHRIDDELAAIVASLKADPKRWYEANGVTPPDWMAQAAERGEDPHRLLKDHETHYRHAHQRSLWAHFANMALGVWLITSPASLGYESVAMTYSDVGAGVLLMIFGFVSLSWQQGWARWVCVAIGFWLLFAPLVFWTESNAAYLNGTLTGLMAIGFAAAVRPPPGVSPVAASTGPILPPGWDNNPSSWSQRLPIILLAFIGFFISRYMAAYQLGHIDGVWEPFFSGTRAGLNGTEDIITSKVSEAWPIPDAGLGANVYALEVMIGLIGAAHRWRSMPWVVATFGVLIVPLGIVSIAFIIIQPIVIGTWCTLCLAMAAAMLLQIAYAFNELVATGQFLKRRYLAGAPVLKIFFTGDTDDGDTEVPAESFQRSPLDIVREAVRTGVNLPWNLALCMLLGAWLMFTRVALGADGGMAEWNHLVGALVITCAVIAMAGSARPVRFLMIPLASALLFSPLIAPAGPAAVVSSIVCGVAIIALSIRRGPISGCYGSWDRLLL